MLDAEQRNRVQGTMSGQTLAKFKSDRPFGNPEAAAADGPPRQLEGFPS